MTRHARQPGADPYRKARFRETAREIVFKDRDDLRSGYAVDTAGSIARALERAFREGFAAGQTDTPAQATAPPAENEPVEWALIPPRPRDSFWTICRFCLGRREDPKSGAKLIPALTERGSPGWLLTTDERRDIKVLAERNIIPLIRLRLLEISNETPASLLISARGKATWERFLERGGHYPEDLTRPDAISR